MDEYRQAAELVDRETRVAGMSMVQKRQNTAHGLLWSGLAAKGHAHVPITADLTPWMVRAGGARCERDLADIRTHLKTGGCKQPPHRWRGVHPRLGFRGKRRSVGED